MRAAEFLRGIADMLAAIEDDNKPATPTVIVNVNGNSAETVAPEVDDGDEDNTDGSGMMMFPQQQKLEIMKKMAGIPNQSSKLKTIVADEDEPFDG